MVATSRTAKSVKNSAVALGFYFINLVLQFFSRKVFLDHLGAEVLGLNTTATNLLQFLNLAELGIGTAIACTLYKPLFDKDTTAINEIVSLQGWMYRRIAWVVIAGSTVLMAFFPWIFAKMPLPLWYAYASFAVLLVSALLSYFVNYKQIVLSADQQEYKIQYSYKAAILVKTLFQIFAVKYFDNGYVWWLVLEVVFAVIASVALNWIVRRTYPYLETSISLGRRLNRKYPDIITKIKQLFFHKIGGFALAQTSPIIIYAYASLSLVALYGNYMLIVMGVTSLMTALFNSMNAGVGNLVAEGDRKQIMNVFEMLFSVRFLLVCILCFGVYTLTPAFITLWIGAEYILDDVTLALMVAIMFINLSRLTVDAYINAYGLFQDIWAPIVEASINVVMSVLLGYFFGLHGILAGVLISLILIVFCWKPYFLFRDGFKVRFRRYMIMYLKHVLVAIAAFIIVRIVLAQIILAPETSFMRFIFTGMVYMLIFGFVTTLGLYWATKGMKNCVCRIFRR
ncbi:sugar transporter [uncultured Alistipes sp.]|jgi:O-antigen/teichoic acid export membrane protein|uniref:lipopolysaccharide biosynthesis protein n=1 Tax=Alistipes sp. TaxID=1872444 RepID=UPI0025EEEF68|nr:sugar transporter [uncultured Alistipes sp.]